MLSIFKRKKIKKLIKYHQDNVINIDTTESDEQNEDPIPYVNNGSENSNDDDSNTDLDCIHNK